VASDFARMFATAITIESASRRRLWGGCSAVPGQRTRAAGWHTVTRRGATSLLLCAWDADQVG